MHMLTLRYRTNTGAILAFTMARRMRRAGMRQRTRRMPQPVGYWFRGFGQ